MSLPCLFIATKADLDLAQQRHEVQPDVYCRTKLQLDIPGLGAGPLNVSAREEQLAELFQRIVGIAVDARGAVPGGGRSRVGGAGGIFGLLFGSSSAAAAGGAGAKTGTESGYYGGPHDGVVSGLTRGRWWVYVLFGIAAGTGGAWLFARRYYGYNAGPFGWVGIVGGAGSGGGGGGSVGVDAGARTAAGTGAAAGKWWSSR